MKGAPAKSRLLSDIIKKVNSVSPSNKDLFSKFFHTEPSQISHLLKDINADFLRDYESRKLEVSRRLKNSGVSDDFDEIERTAKKAGIQQTLLKYFFVPKYSCLSQYVQLTTVLPEHKCQAYEHLLGTVLSILKQYDQVLLEKCRLNRSKLSSSDNSLLYDRTTQINENMEDFFGKLDISTIENRSVIENQKQISEINEVTQQFNKKLEAYKDKIRQMSEKERQMAEREEKILQLKQQFERYRNENSQSWKKMKQNQEQLQIQNEQRRIRYENEKQKLEELQQKCSRLQTQKNQLYLSFKNAQQHLLFIDKAQTGKRIIQKEEEVFKKQGEIEELAQKIKSLNQQLLSAKLLLSENQKLLQTKSEELKNQGDQLRKQMQQQMESRTKDLNRQLMEQLYRDQQDQIKPVTLVVSSFGQSFRQLIKQADFWAKDDASKEMFGSIQTERNSFKQFRYKISEGLDSMPGCLKKFLYQCMQMSEAYGELLAAGEKVKLEQKHQQKIGQLSLEIKELNNNVKVSDEQISQLLKDKQVTENKLKLLEQEMEKLKNQAIIEAAQQRKKLDDLQAKLDFNEMRNEQSQKKIVKLEHKTEEQQGRIDHLVHLNATPFRVSAILEIQRTKAQLLTKLIEGFSKQKITRTVLKYSRDPFRINFSCYLMDNLINLVLLFRMAKTERVVGVFASSIVTPKAKEDKQEKPQAFIFSLEKEGVMFPCVSSQAKEKEVIRYNDSILRVGNDELLIRNNSQEKKIELNTQIIGNKFYRIPHPEALMGSNLQQKRYHEYEHFEIHQVFF